MTSQRSPVVVGVDGSPGSDAAVRWAAEEARRLEVPLRAVHVYRSLLSYGATLSPRPEREEAAVREAGERLANDAAALATWAVPGLDVTASAVAGGPVLQLLVEAAGASVLVLGSRRLHTLGSFVLGSVSGAVAARATCPVVVVRGPAGAGPARDQVVAGIDGSELSQLVLGFAFEHAVGHDLEVHAVFCWPPRSHSHGRPTRQTATGVRTRAEAWLSEALAGWQQKYPGVRILGEVVDAGAAAGLVQAADGANLLVVGTRGRYAHGGTVLGSVSQGVLHHATCPVAIIPAHRR